MWNPFKWETKKQRHVQKIEKHMENLRWTNIHGMPWEGWLHNSHNTNGRGKTMKLSQIENCEVTGKA